MAATGKTPILLYGSTTASNVPVAGNLTNSSDGCEIAINVADKNLFFKDSTNAVNTVPIRQSSGSSDGWLSSTDWSTFNGKAPAFTYTTGYIPFGQGTTTPTQDSSLFWDNTNKRLGVGTSSPSYGLDVAYSSTSTNFRVVGNGSASVDTRAIFANVGNGGSNRGVAISMQPSGSVSSVEAVKLIAYQNSNSATANNAAFTIQVANSSGTLTEYQRISNAGDITVSAGNLVIGTSGKGIDFSATAGTGTSELLADYEEGTWTPSVTAGTGTITTVGTVVGRYTKVGRQVTIWSTIAVTTNGTGASYLNVTGIPYTPSTDITHYTSAGTNTSTVKTVNSYLLSGGTIRLWYYDGSYPIASGQTIAFCISYFV